MNAIGKHEQATECFDKAIKINPKNEKTWNNKGSTLNAIGKHEQATECFDKAIKINPKNYRALYNKGVALDAIGKHEEAIECFDKAIKINPKNESSWYNKGVALDDLGKYEQAIECYDKAIKIDPKKDNPWNNKGSALGNLGKYEEAIECFDKAIKINPKNESSWYNKGVALDDLGKHEQAIECFDKAIKINPKNESSWYNKGVALDDLGKYEQAIECYDKAIKIDPKKDNPWNNKGTALNGIGKYEEAIECYDEAIKIDPKKDNPWNNKGSALGNLGKYEEAIECFDKAIKINPKNESSWYNKGVALDDLGKHEQAIECFDKAIKINPKNENTWNNKGRVLGKLRNIDDALKSFGHAYLLNKGIQLGEDYSLMLAEPTRIKEVEIISRVLDENKKDWVKISVVQLNYSLVSNKHPKDFGFILEDAESVRSKVFEALNLARKKSVDLICFPELSTKEEWVEKIIEQYNDMIIIFGSYYKKGFNICPIIINGTAYNYHKINPSPNFETEIIAGRCMKQGKNIFLFQTLCGTIIVLNCMDYLKEVHSILEQLEKKGTVVDLIVVPQYNKSVRLFQEHANQVCQQYGCPYILHVNGHEVLEEKVDGTSMIGFEHDGALRNYKMIGIKPEDNIRFKLFEVSGEKMMIFKLDLKNRGNIIPARGPKIKCVQKIPLKS